MAASGKMGWGVEQVRVGASFLGAQAGREYPKIVSLSLTTLVGGKQLPLFTDLKGC